MIDTKHSDEVDFTFSKYKTYYKPEQIVAAMSVFQPSLRKRKIRLPVKIDTISKLQVLWRRRVRELRDLGWDRADTNLRCMDCLNCQPYLVCCMPKTNFCTSLICPFCHMRNVVMYANKIFDAFPKLKKGERAQNWLVQYKFDRKYLSSKKLNFDNLLVQMNRGKEILRETGLEASLFNTIFQPELNWRERRDSDYTDDKDCWNVSHRGLLMVKRGWIPPDLPKEISAATCWIKKRPYRKNISAAIMNTLRYPRGYIYGNPKWILDSLNVRKGHRLMSTSGKFRKGQVYDERRICEFREEQMRKLQTSVCSNRSKELQVSGMPSKS